MKEQNEKDTEKKKPGKKSEKKFYLITAIGCAVALIAIIIVAVVVGGADTMEGMRPSSSNNPSSSSSVVDDSSSTSNNSSDDGKGDSSGDEPVVSVPDGMVMPIEAATMGQAYGFHHNQTLNKYFVHTGLDFMAEAGTEVLAVEDGVVESIYKDDILLGTEIVVAHADGVKSTYRFVTEKEGLKVGDTVSKGDCIAVVAEPTGNEYKDGAHLHFEISANGEKVDPTTYLTLEEK